MRNTCFGNYFFFPILIISVLFEDNSGVSGETVCEYNVDCDTEGAICFEKLCVCSTGYLFNSDRTKCIPEVFGYGSTCEDNVQCSARLEPGGQCRNGTCACAENFHYHLGRCFKSAGLGEECRDNNHCFSDNDFQSTVCEKDKKCRCSDGYYQREYSSCRKISKAVGEPCAIQQDCHFENATCTMARICDYSNSTSKKAWLSDEPISSTFGTSTLDRGPSVGIKCSDTQDCNSIINSYCSGGRCLCMTGFYHSEDMLACHPEIGAKCASDVDCEGRYTMCQSNTTCTCRPGFVARPDNKLCMKQARNIGWSCLRDIQCSLFGEGGVCVKKKCRCKPGTHFEKSHLFCWRTLALGQQCLSQEDCRGEGRSCSNNKCTCESGYHPAKNNIDCRRNVNTTGGNCSDNIDCVFDNSFCNNGVCACVTGFFSTGNSTCKTGIEGDCLRNSDCLAINSICLRGKCVCPDNHISNREGSSCLKVAKMYGSPCMEHSQCTMVFGSLAQCDSNHICSCIENAHYFYDKSTGDLGYCYQNVNLNQNCTKDAQCIDSRNAEQRSVECRKGFCKCRFGFNYNKISKFCSGGNQLRTSHFELLLILLYMLQ